MDNPKCKICRRLGLKLFLKGDRCFSPKCAMIKRPYPPGQKAKRKSKALSEYGKELAEKQKMKNWYNLRERQFAKYVREALDKRSKNEDAGALLFKKLESRLDSVVFRMGFASSRVQASQEVGHGHFLVNGKKIDVPSYHAKKGDKISISPFSAKKAPFQNLTAVLKKYNPPSWIKIDPEKLEGELIKDANMEEASFPIEVSSIFEFYSK
ncbi:MAG: 30S ribosomal protein S4 [Candidatus Nealsonbacteria bacterium RIFCSPLOWO2_12_FULL_39_31]|uniref:Small ribosomal subunit protein uS4 n=3 Tax=Candidatus Nealsoniibacteriota TaxID=1817911 RepID=A0A1G2EF24_9BACT|nr:MAG: 30S ribosomal protein S4 [Parcubacteria group bacterium GW2011_GWA2_38_27]OGZ19441.1 MAG: 30S ribosomal protein S4 [Candidatus Nealsonbacteria bacterium RIFCSPHIGHO2_01_FULL_38_55]OGZ21174.1 MAG: 30S ribosomal protein S4 [Candidatus Nealsonbacteria bacterium RIFCSPHIGHO2_02_38_10]OGZ21476.1 MAG: 30S ribosomal protein S4 [Candidatus Nealsonbacteria bacterium RIFCSPHIGHO2_02_FULL_38_75]OGZ22609.1 MAG: 30S ribosomal protein S4 [Candidatus Nealsonbacteria bacterium RIFCSPLOWO2_01_FULL_38_12